MNEIVKVHADNGQEVQITPQDITKYICHNATQKEVALFLAHCKAHNLDPIGSKDAYLVKYGDAPASIITSYQVFNRRARKCPDYSGIKSGVVTLKDDGTVLHKQGSAHYPEVDGILIGGWAEVYVKGWEAPAYCEVSLKDYSTGKSSWKKFPGVMIEKVAKASAWRLAFPDEFSGMYTQEEMDQAKPDEPKVIEAEVVEPADPLEPIRAKFPEFMNSTGLSPQEAMGAICDFAGVSTMQEITQEQVPEIIDFMSESYLFPEDKEF